MANGRCRMHGGASTGPRDPSKLHGNGNAIGSGLYTQRLLPGEDEILPHLWDDIESLDEEIVGAKLLLRRAYEAQAAAESGRKEAESTLAAFGQPAAHAETLGALYPVAMVEVETAAVTGGKTIRVRTTRSRHGYTEEITRLTGSVARLVLARAQLRKLVLDDDQLGGVADRFREFADRAWAVTCPPPPVPNSGDAPSAIGSDDTTPTA